jgi:hypothetical protein
MRAGLARVKLGGSVGEVGDHTSRLQRLGLYAVTVSELLQSSWHE